jgi:hypothetical protein
MQSLERFLDEKYAAEIENIYIGDTRYLLNGSVRLKDALNDHIHRYLQGKILVSRGLELDVTVTTKTGNLLYPAVFEEDREPVFPRDATLIASENFSLLNEGLILKLDAQIAHNKLLSNAILAFFIALSLTVLYLHYKRTTKRILQDEIDKRRELTRLVKLETETSRRLENLNQERDKLTADLHQLKDALQNEKNKATRNEEELFEEIEALEKKLNANLGLQNAQQEEIRSLKAQLEVYETEKQKGDKKKTKAGRAAGKRFTALYKNIAVNERALEGYVELSEDLKIKAEEVIHQLNQDPEQVIIKRKVFIGKRDRKTIKEVIFGYKGRLYFQNLNDNRIEVLAIGTKNTQAREMAFLNRL